MHTHNTLMVVIALVGFMGLAGCQTKEGGESSASPASGKAVETSTVKELTGAGASFPEPVYTQWAYTYGQLKDMQVTYQAIGSSGGQAQIKAKTVDFGASDAPMSAEDLDAAGLIQFPMVVGGIVPVANISGVQSNQLKLTPGVLADIFLGTITNWNDPAIAAINTDIEFPDKEIIIVHRADGSGTTWNFTNYLSKISDTWKEQVGFGKAVQWPAKNAVGGKGNQQVAALVQQTEGTIGYVEYAYAAKGGLAAVKMQNQAGEFVEPSMASFQAAAANADWQGTPGFAVVLTDQPGKDSWPIAAPTFILIHIAQEDPATGKAMLNFFHWCYEHGDEAAEKLHYVPMPDNVVAMVEQAWANELEGDLWTAKSAGE